MYRNNDRATSESDSTRRLSMLGWAPALLALLVPLSNGCGEKKVQS